MQPIREMQWTMTLKPQFSFRKKYFALKHINQSRELSSDSRTANVVRKMGIVFERTSAEYGDNSPESKTHDGHPHRPTTQIMEIHVSWHSGTACTQPDMDSEQLFWNFGNHNRQALLYTMIMFLTIIGPNDHWVFNYLSIHKKFEYARMAIINKAL